MIMIVRDDYELSYTSMAWADLERGLKFQKKKKKNKDVLY